MKLNEEDFAHVIKNAPLIAIDLIIEKDGKYLLGKRNNEPAKGYLFTVGGRIMKNERMPDAFARVARDEIGRELSIANAEPLGVCTHLYDNNMFNKDYGTHYVVLPYKISIDFDVLIDSQHEEFVWMTKEELLADDNVHGYTKDYHKG